MQREREARKGETRGQGKREGEAAQIHMGARSTQTGNLLI